MADRVVCDVCNQEVNGFDYLWIGHSISDPKDRSKPSSTNDFKRIDLCQKCKDLIGSNIYSYWHIIREYIHKKMQSTEKKAGT